MQITEKAEFGFTEEIESKSGVENPLGMSSNLGIQSEFTRGITSQSRRARYYTLWAHYYENLRRDKIVTNKNLERLFILSCLEHHGGDAFHSRLNSIINKTRFDDEWDEYDSFTLDFEINGQGYGNYISQLRKLKCAWMVDDKMQTSPLNRKLAEALQPISDEVFERERYPKEFIGQELSHLCPCQEHEEEQEVLAKLLFGFFSKQDGEWDLDDDEFSEFMRGEVELEFEEAFDEDESIESMKVRQRNLRRRNTLFLFLKIINESQPEDTPRSIQNTIWNGMYFRQRDDETELEFGDLERSRQYWEYFILNSYYIYCLEELLLSLHTMINKNPRIEIERMKQEFGGEELVGMMFDILGDDVRTVGELLSVIEEQNGEKRTWIDSPVNEMSLKDGISSSDGWKEKSAYSLLMILLLKHRYELTEERVRSYKNESSGGGIYMNQLNIDSVLGRLDEEEDVKEFTKKLIIKIKNRHRVRTTSRFSDKDGTKGTRAWLFTEQEGRLSPSNQNGFNPRTRDNRWRSIKGLLVDLNFVHREDEKAVLTQRGEQWLNQIE